MYIEKATRFFDLIRNRDLPNTRVYLEFIVVLIMWYATVFSVRTEGLFLSFVKVNKYSIQCSDASLDHTDHWIILFIGDIYCFSFLFKVRCLLEDLIQGDWLCRHPCDPMYHAYDFISTNHGYLYTCTKLCIPPLVHLDYLISKVVNSNNCIKKRYKVFKINI